MSPTICLAIALAIGIPADPRPSWRNDFAPSPPVVNPRPPEPAEPSPYGVQTGQIMLRNCWPRGAGVDRLHEQGYRRLSADMLNDGSIYERWGHADGAWNATVTLPERGIICPLFAGPAWRDFAVPDR